MATRRKSGLAIGSASEGIAFMQRVVEFAVVFACRNEAEAVDGLECDDADHKGCGKVPSSSVGDDERLRHFGVPVLWLESIPLDGRSEVRCSAPTASHGPADGLLAAGPCEGSAEGRPAAARGSLRRPSALRSLGPGFGHCLGRRVLGCGAFGFRPEDRDLVLPKVQAVAEPRRAGDTREVRGQEFVGFDQRALARPRPSCPP